jgi:hypothetical protein
MATAQSIGGSRAPSNAKPKHQSFINLVSSDEDDSSTADEGLNRSKIPPPPKPVANGKPNAYAQTNRAVNGGGPKKLRVAG